MQQQQQQSNRVVMRSSSWAAKFLGLAIAGCLILSTQQVAGQECTGFKPEAEEFVSIKYNEQNRRWVNKLDSRQ